jgi:hypothetical protein
MYSDQMTVKFIADWVSKEDQVEAWRLADPAG